MNYANIKTMSMRDLRDELIVTYNMRNDARNCDCNCDFINAQIDEMQNELLDEMLTRMGAQNDV